MGQSWEGLAHEAQKQKPFPTKSHKSVAYACLLCSKAGSDRGFNGGHWRENHAQQDFSKTH